MDICYRYNQVLKEMELRTKQIRKELNCIKLKRHDYVLKEGMFKSRKYGSNDFMWEISYSDKLLKIIDGFKNQNLDIEVLTRSKPLQLSQDDHTNGIADFIAYEN